MREITVPRLNSNEDTCVLNEWSCADGKQVEDQELLAVVETSKAAAELYSEGAGVFQALVPAGSECRVGEVIGYLFGDDSERLKHLQTRGNGRNETEVPALVLTESARRLSERHGVSDKRLRSLGKRIVRASDVERLVAPGEAQAGDPLSRRQQAIANVVSLSHREVPDAFLAMRADCGALLDRLREVNVREDLMLGLPEVAVGLLGGLKSAFPSFFASFGKNGLLRVPSEGAHVGVTVDVGNGLFIPVVRDADALTVREIGDRLMEFRHKALRDDFQQYDLGGGQLTLSLAMDPDVLVSVPIILPPQVCIVSLGSLQHYLILAPDGQVRQGHQLTIGLSYDHRVINGRAAAAFLTAFKTAVERPQEVRL